MSGRKAPEWTMPPDDIFLAYQADYARYQYQWTMFLAEHLADMSRAFKGDLQMMLVLAIVGEAQLSQMVEAGSNDVTGERTVNASRIADRTGIPRETVRRKLEKVRKRGWIDRTPEGAWFMIRNGQRSQVRVDLNDLDLQARKRIATMIYRFNRLLTAPDA